jgi:hypothetical protein
LEFGGEGKREEGFEFVLWEVQEKRKKSFTLFESVFLKNNK